MLPIHRMYFYYVTSFSLFVMSCVCQLFNKEYMMMYDDAVYQLNNNNAMYGVCRPIWPLRHITVALRK